MSETQYAVVCPRFIYGPVTKATAKRMSVEFLNTCLEDHTVVEWDPKVHKPGPVSEPYDS